jgi:hypothetical protein
MLRLSRTAAVAGLAAFAVACASTDGADTTAADAPVNLLADGLDGLEFVGPATWTFENGELVGVGPETGPPFGWAVTPELYGDFEVTVEFFVPETHNSGVYFRCQDPADITDRNCYEANIFDNRPDQSGRTGGIPNYLAPIATVDAANKWNTYVIRVEGDRITITLNDVVTIDGHDPTNAAPGPIAIQAAVGEVRVRRFEVRGL